MRERAGYLERLADRLHEHRDELGLMDCVDSGNGVVAKINPFNHPFRFCAEKAAAALAAGNTVVVKGPEQAQGTAVRPGIELPPLSPPSGPIKLVSANAGNVTSGDCSL
jgi:acyl-CoA reductase-like NAD-dependent aldehyde dehydrogenase